MMHHMEELGTGGCTQERAAFVSVYPQFAASASSGSSSGRRLAGSSSGSSSAPRTPPALVGVTGPEFAALEACIMKDCFAEVAHLCQGEPNVFTMIGHTGVSMMIFESGMHFDFEKARIVGPWACVVAVLGTLLPLGAGMLLVWLYGEPAYPDGLAAGVALAPTSIGIALKLLLEAKQLQKDFGQAIITAAFVDDILSLVAFNVLFSATSGQFTFMSAIFPSILGMVFLIVGAGLGISVWPFIVKEVCNRVAPKKGVHSLSRQDEVLLLIMFSLLLSYATLTYYLGTHLWGCFVAGMSFAMIHHAHHVWVRQVKRITVWLIRVFFSCTVAFAIPWQSLIDLESFWKGSVMGIFACVATKVFCAFFMGDARFVIGWAMVGRAEFAYLIAEMAKSSITQDGKPIMSAKVFAIVIWSLLYATLLAPFCFRKVLGRYAIKLAAKGDDDANMVKGETTGEVLSSFAGASASADKAYTSERKHAAGYTHMDGVKWNNEDLGCFTFQIIYPNRTQACSVEDMQEIWKVLHKHGFSITLMQQQCDMDTHLCSFQVESEDGKAFEKSELTFVQEEIYRELQGMDAHLLFLPSMHSLDQKCKLAKVTVIMDVNAVQKENGGSLANVSNIIEAVRVKSFYIMRAGIEIHGGAAILTFLIGHLSSLAQQGASYDPENEEVGARRRPSFPSSPNAGPTKAEHAMDHLLVGSSGLPDIMPEELKELKTRIEEAAAEVGRLHTVVQPLTYQQGPLGEVMHDAKTLMSTQEGDPTCEIRFTVDSAPKEMFPRVMNCLAKPSISLVSARMDEMHGSAINCVISSPELTASLEAQLMDELAELAESFGVTGHIDLANINSPLEKQYRHLGKDTPGGTPLGGYALPPPLMETSGLPSAAAGSADGRIPAQKANSPKSTNIII
eukprot:TRINITY_DN1632_c0_g1_i1.p1 TRINITY_DN1632_c0_g1~~TRINITY_DN1632_c0_g1_i1.p1  ORF type:complete len:1010 (+),score=215.35 TRINITY_DN1632_c0_g1_i1:322-3030(+)